MGTKDKKGEFFTVPWCIPVTKVTLNGFDLGKAKRRVMTHIQDAILYGTSPCKISFSEVSDPSKWESLPNDIFVPEVPEHEQCVDKATLNREYALKVTKEMMKNLRLASIRPDWVKYMYLPDEPFSVNTGLPAPEMSDHEQILDDSKKSVTIRRPHPFKIMSDLDALKPTKTRFVFAFRFKYVSQMVKQSFECTCEDYSIAYDKFIKHIGSRKMIQDNFTVEEFPEGVGDD